MIFPSRNTSILVDAPSLPAPFAVRSWPDRPHTPQRGQEEGRAFSYPFLRQGEAEGEDGDVVLLTEGLRRLCASSFPPRLTVPPTK